MRKTSVLVTAVAMLAVASMAQAMTMTPGTGMKGSWFIGPMGGLTMPVGDLSKDFNTTSSTEFGADQGMGFNIGGLLDYALTDQIGIGIDGAYNTTKSKDDIPDAPGVSLKATTTSFGAHAEWFLPTGGKVLPYLGAGVGYYNKKFKSDGASPEIEAKKGGIGVNGGVGVALMASPSMGFGVDARYHWTPKDSFDFGPGIGTTPDVNWSFITINAVLTFRIPMGGGAASGGSMTH